MEPTHDSKQINSLPPGKFLVLDFDVRLGVLGKVIKGNFGRKKNVLPRYLSLKIFQSVFRINTTFFYQRIFITVYCLLAGALLNSNPLEFFKYLDPFTSYVKNNLSKNFLSLKNICWVFWIKHFVKCVL